MRFAIFGVGGVGGYYGGRLAQAGHDLTFIARGEHLRAIQEQGLRVESVKGDFTIYPAQATDDPAAVGPVDVVILGVKTWQVPEAAEAIRPLIGPETVVLPLQNGVEAPDQLAAVCGREHVLGGLTKIFSFIIGPGHIRHVGGPASISFGELDNQSRPRTNQLLTVLQEAGIAADIAPQIQVALWEKMLFVVSLGGVGAVTRAPIGIIRSIPETRAMLEEAMGEISAVARVRQIALEDNVVARTMLFVDSQPAAAVSSLQRDISAGRPSELEAWNGAVVRLGRQANVPTPLHDYIYRSLLPSELQARGQLQYPV